MAKIKITVCLLLLVAFVAAACGEKDDTPSCPPEPIALSYEPMTPIPFDNEARHIQLIVSDQSMPILICGGAHFTLTNHTPEIIDYELDGDVFVIHALAVGEGEITISDRWDSYTLKVDVVSAPAVSGRLYTYSYVKTDGMDPKKKAELEQKIIANAPTGAWHFGMPVIIEGERSIAKRYMTLNEDSEYKEYNCVCKREYPATETAFWLPTQVVTWFTMKSDTEEFVLYLCQPIVFDDFRVIRGYNLVINVTNKYIDEYPEIKGAYEIQTGYPQPDFD